MSVVCVWMRQNLLFSVWMETLACAFILKSQSGGPVLSEASLTTSPQTRTPRLADSLSIPQRFCFDRLTNTAPTPLPAHRTDPSRPEPSRGGTRRE